MRRFLEAIQGRGFYEAFLHVSKLKAVFLANLFNKIIHYINFCIRQLKLRTPGFFIFNALRIQVRNSLADSGHRQLPFIVLLPSICQ